MKRLNEELINNTLKTYTGDNSILASGWASKGLKNYFIGVTKDNLYILRVSMTLKPKEIRIIPLSNLEAYSPRKGQADMPGWMKLNVESLLMDLMTSTLTIKEKNKPVEYYKFNTVIGYKNPPNAFKIAQAINLNHPEIPTKIPESLKKIRKAPFWKTFLTIFFIIFLIFEAGLPLVIPDFSFSRDFAPLTFGVLISAAIIALVFTPFIPLFKRILTGHD